MKNHTLGRLRRLGAIALIIGIPTLAGAEEFSERHDHAARDHVVVRVGTLGLDPIVRSATPEQAIVWLNYANFPVRITLSESAATRIQCREPSHFELAADGSLRATWVDQFGAASLCLLEPGAYRYVVEQLDEAERPPTPLLGGRRFEGQLSIVPEVDANIEDLRSLVSFHRAAERAPRDIATAREELAQLQEDAGRAEDAAATRQEAALALAAAKKQAAAASALKAALEAR